MWKTSLRPNCQVTFLLLVLQASVISHSNPHDISSLGVTDWNRTLSASFRSSKPTSS